jgi:thiamine-monophosphate kinase
MNETVSKIGEFGLIDRIDRLIEREGVGGRGVSVSIGDDTAAFRSRPGFDVLVTCDAMVEGKHYLPKHTTFFNIGRRAMAINISDIGAMGGMVLYALVSLGLRPDAAVREIESLYRGFLAELNPLGAAIIGGNITSVDERMFVDVTLIGEVEEERAVKRSGARPGDTILVTGSPGKSAAGLHLLLSAARPETLYDHPLVHVYLVPSHRAPEGRAAAVTGAVTAMIDISDGLLGDLGHICTESGCRALIYQEKLPVSDLLREAGRGLGRDPYDWVLGDSDDYELLITCRPGDERRLRESLDPFSGLKVSEIGRMIEGSPSIILAQPDGTQRPAGPSGWDHFKPKPSDSHE